MFKKTGLLLIFIILLLMIDSQIVTSGGNWWPDRSFKPITREYIMTKSSVMADSIWLPQNEIKVGSETFHPTKTYRGIPYRFGGRDNWTHFFNKIKRGVQPDGSDCSAFVSHSWYLPHRYSTREFEQDATNISWPGSLNYVQSLGAIGSGASVINDMLPGDAFNKSGDHIIMLESKCQSGGIISIEQTPGPRNIDRPDPQCGDRNNNTEMRRFWSWSHLEDYRPIRRNKVIAHLDSVSLSAYPESPTIPGEQVTFTAEVEGGTNPEFRFYYRVRGGSWRPTGEISTNNTFTTSKSTTGDFEVGVLARSIGSDVTVRDSISHTIAIPPVESVNLTAEPDSPTAPGEPVTFTATAEGGTSPQYAFYFQPPAGTIEWTQSQSYSDRNTFTGAPQSEGEYKIGVRVKSKGSSESYEAQDIIYHLVEEEAARQEGFDINFSRSAGSQGWRGYPRSAWSLSANELFTRGRTGKFTSAVYSDINFANFDYSVRARRTDSASSAQYVFVRAGSEAGVTSYKLYPGYLFGYANSGGYSIWKINNDGSYQPPLQGWTRTNAINRFGFNTLRVRAIGGNFQFYINGTLVKTITDYTFSRGMVGFTMARNEDDPSTTRFGVNWAKLSPVTASSTTLLEEKVSPEQEGLNQEVIDSGVVGSPYGDW